jgi:hypothetical protein
MPKWAPYLNLVEDEEVHCVSSCGEKAARSPSNSATDPPCGKMSLSMTLAPSATRAEAPASRKFPDKDLLGIWTEKFSLSAQVGQLKPIE